MTALWLLLIPAWLFACTLIGTVPLWLYRDKWWNLPLAVAIMLPAVGAAILGSIWIIDRVVGVPL